MIKEKVDGLWREPIKQQSCAYCGGPIYLGNNYYLHDGLSICSECVHRYAWAMFELYAERVTAQPDTALILDEDS